MSLTGYLTPKFGKKWSCSLVVLVTGYSTTRLNDYMTDHSNPPERGPNEASEGIYAVTRQRKNWGRATPGFWQESEDCPEFKKWWEIL